MSQLSKNKILLLLCVAGQHLQQAQCAPPPKPGELDHTYTFERYVSDFHRDYEIGSQEWTDRNQIFDDNLSNILSHNRLFYGNDGNGDVTTTMETNESLLPTTYTKGINEFTDRKESEIYFGYDKSQHPAYYGSSSTTTSRRLHASKLPFENEDVSSLPEMVDWREKGVVTEPKNQGACGSCWAFASTAALESHVAINTKKLLKLSPQDLVSCVSNPQHCGGSGGCQGATAELAFDYVVKNGLLLDSDFPYEQTDGTCGTLSSSSSGLRGDGMMEMLRKKKAAVGIEGYATVPTNDYKTLMNAVAKTGPVVIAVAANGWGFYDGGIYSDDDDNADADINHAVVVVGYGTDKQTGEDYWLVRNSWGAGWGEDGYIRIQRNEGKKCAVDSTPVHGVACTEDEKGNAIIPPAVKVCGTSGILFDGVLPVKAHLMP